MSWHEQMPAEYRNAIVTGDARELAERIPDESIDLIFTDPVYQNVDDYRWLAETAARVLKPDRACLVFYATKLLPDIIETLGRSLTWRWQFIEYRANEVKTRPATCGRTLYTGILWFDKGISRHSFAWDIRSVSMNAPQNSVKHIWGKPSATIKYYLSHFSILGSIIFDPFTGSATVPTICKMLGRQYVAFEIDPATAALARQRVQDTQPPLPGCVIEQMEMEAVGEP